MKEDFYKYLLEISGKGSMVLPNGRVSFEINTLGLILDFDQDIFSEDENFTLVERIENFLDRLVKATLQKIVIQRLEILEGLPYTDSITSSMYFIVKNLTSFNAEYILGYDTYFDYRGLDEKDFDDGGMCPSPLTISFKIFVNLNLGATTLFLEQLLGLSLNLPKIEGLYFFFFQKYEEYFSSESLKDNHELSILQTNTKARRLGYLKLLSTLFDSGKQHPINRFTKVVEEQASKVEKDLMEYRNTKGLIKKTKSGISAKPYVELAHDLDLLNYLRSSVVQGKMFKVYTELRAFELIKSNYFELTKLDKLFFLEQILRQDALYIFVTLESLFLYGESSLLALQPIFHESLLKRLKKFEYFVRDKGDERKAKQLQEVKQRVEGWEKPEKYLEHVLMPRLNWMLDLDLVSFSQKNTFNITDTGERLLKHYWDWQDLYGEVVINPNGILDFVYIAVFNDLYEGGIGNQQTEEVIKERIAAVLLDSFEHFKTIAPNRVTASQAIAFTQNYLFLKESIKTGKPYIRRLLSEEFTDKFIYKYQPQYKDGYIQIIKQP